MYGGALRDKTLYGAELSRNCLVRNMFLDMSCGELVWNGSAQSFMAQSSQRELPNQPSIYLAESSSGKLHENVFAGLGFD